MVTASATEDLSTDATVVSAPECVKLVGTLVALFAIGIWHPVLLEIRVFVRLGSLNIKVSLIICTIKI